MSKSKLGNSTVSNFLNPSMALKEGALELLLSLLWVGVQGRDDKACGLASLGLREETLDEVRTPNPGTLCIKVVKRQTPPHRRERPGRTLVLSLMVKDGYLWGERVLRICTVQWCVV